MAILYKYMQGLRQGAKVWGEYLHKWIMGYDPRIACSIKAGKCVYSVWTGDLKMVFARWVDDLFGFSSDDNKTFNELLKALSEAYPLKITGDMVRVLRMEVEYGNGWCLLDNMPTSNT